MQKPDQESQQDIPVKIKHDLLWHGKRQETDDIPPCKGFGLFGDHGQPAIGAFELEIVFDFHNDSEREFLSAMWAGECFLGIHTFFCLDKTDGPGPLFCIQTALDITGLVQWSNLLE